MKALKVVLLLLLLLLALAALALAMFPASAALRWAGGQLGPLQLGEVGGTVWEGHAGTAQAFGEPLGRLSWTVSPLSVVRGAPQLQLELQGERYQGSAGALLQGAMSAELTDVRLTLPAATLRAALDIPALVPSGRVEIELPHARIERGYPRALRGTATWREAAVSGQAAAALGDLHAEFSTTADGAISGVLSDLGGPLQLEGSFRFALTGYEAEALVRSRSADPAIDRVLDHVGQRQADGSSYLKITGSLLPIR